MPQTEEKILLTQFRGMNLLFSRQIKQLVVITHNSDRQREPWFRINKWRIRTSIIQLCYLHEGKLIFMSQLNDTQPIFQLVISIRNL